MKLVYLTHKAAASIDEKSLRSQIGDFKLFPISMVYINCFDGWTTEECDNIAYVVEDDGRFPTNDK